MEKYFYESLTLVLRDAPLNSDFHIRSGDFFSFIATLMGSFEETLATCECEAGKDIQARQQRLARELRHTLRFLQAHYTILPRALEDIQEVRPSGDLLSR